MRHVPSVATIERGLPWLLRTRVAWVHPGERERADWRREGMHRAAQDIRGTLEQAQRPTPHSGTQRDRTARAFAWLVERLDAWGEGHIEHGAQSLSYLDVGGGLETTTIMYDYRTRCWLIGAPGAWCRERGIPVE